MIEFIFMLFLLMVIVVVAITAPVGYAKEARVPKRKEKSNKEDL